MQIEELRIGDILFNLEKYRIIGFEGEEDQGNDEGDDDSGDGDDDDGDDGSGDEGSDDSKGKGDGENVDGLKSALRKERMRAKKAERELNRLKKQTTTQDDKDKSDKEKAEQERDAAKARSEKLADRLRTTEVNNLIIKHATTLKFRDLDDALALINRDDIDVDQDDEDPADIEVDEDSVKAALKKLVDKKPHLILGDGEEQQTGGKFGGRKDKSKDALSEEALRERYPALRR